LTPSPFEVASEELDGGILALAIRGELDLSTAPQLEQPLQGGLDEGEAPILIDLSACEFIDSTGIALIVKAWQRLESAGNGRRLAVCSGNDQVQRLLELTGVESSIPVFGERDEALTALRG
jgi:anti-sigma B factor antagonist